MTELAYAVQKGKRIVALMEREPDKGGISVEQV